MKITVSDPFGAASDAQLPTLALALNPIEARKELKRGLQRLSHEGRLHLRAIRVTRHKPGRRCVLEYDVKRLLPEHAPEIFTLVGKIRARRFGNESYRLLEQIWDAGFDSESVDRISVPEPIGVIARFQMWFQRKVPGETATSLLAEPGATQLAQQIAAAIHKLHIANIPTDRCHTMADELRILHECLGQVINKKPELRKRLELALAACDRLGTNVPEPRPCGIHRDFYPAQVLVSPNNSSRPRIHLIDFDLYCLGDPALDIGNFIGHMSEHSLRAFGNPDAAAVQEEALQETFMKLSKLTSRAAIQAYKTLTLVRHIYLSTQFPDRKDFTPALLELCEKGLGL
jgi:hypothetical protein